ncbi:MAG: CoA-binding protein [Deltaproteobacteria bacterium]|nr:CoA-binding protein [Deltaproteobacteria bacterium]
MSAFENPADAVIRSILAQPKTIAVVGCSPDPDRDSHMIAALLKAKGHRVIPVNPTATTILGERCYASVRDIPEKVDMVDVFRRPEFVDEIADDAIATGAQILWLQLDVIHEPAARKAQAAGLTVVMDRCPAIEYRRLF